MKDMMNECGRTGGRTEDRASQGGRVVSAVLGGYVVGHASHRQRLQRHDAVRQHQQLSPRQLSGGGRRRLLRARRGGSGVAHVLGVGEPGEGGGFRPRVLRWLAS